MGSGHFAETCRKSFVHHVHLKTRRQRTDGDTLLGYCGRIALRWEQCDMMLLLSAVARQRELTHVSMDKLGCATLIHIGGEATYCCVVTTIGRVTLTIKPALVVYKEYTT
jgi:hypothetical protein